MELPLRRGCEAGRGRDGRQFSPEARLEARLASLEARLGRGRDLQTGEARRCGSGRQAGLSDISVIRIIV